MRFEVMVEEGTKFFIARVARGGGGLFHHVP